MAELGIQTSGLQAPPQVERQSTNKEAVVEFRAPTTGDELTEEKWVVGDSLVEGEVVAEEPAI